MNSPQISDAVQPDMGVAHIGLGGRVHLVNKRLCEILGYSRDELLRFTFQDLTRSEAWEIEGSLVARLLAGAIQGFALERRHVRKDGATVWVQVSVSLVRDATGAPAYFVAVLEDITARQPEVDDHARRLEQERAARARVETTTSRLRAVQTITDATLSSLALDDLLRELLARTRAALDADLAAILLLSDDGQHLTVRAATGVDAAGLPGLSVPVGEGFAGRIAATREPMIVNDPGIADVDAPNLAWWVRSVVGVPLVVETQVIGVLHVGSARPRCFTNEDVNLLQLVADRAALAIDRARLYEAERAARAAAEGAQWRLQFLAEAGAAFSSTLDYDATISSLARLVVPRLADWCVVDVSEHHAAARNTRVEHPDAATADLVRELWERVPLDPENAHPIFEAVRSGRPQLLAEITDELIVTFARNSKDLGGWRSLGAEAAMVVPLLVHGHTIGVVLLVSGMAGRYGPDDLALAEELAHRAALALTNAHLYREAQEALSVRDEFLTSVSHDLRTPLTAAKGFAQILQRRVERRGVEGLGRDVLVEGFVTIDASLTRMSSLVSQLLDLSRLQSGRTLDLELRHTELVALVERVVAEHQRVTDHHKIIVEAGAAAVMGTWDSLMLERMLSNLLSNAIKYSPFGGEVKVSVTHVRDGAGEWAVLAVNDAGLGIPDGDLRRIFERFHRGANVVGRIPGTGIGMAGARQIVEQHGGTIVVESEENTGTTVTIRLPLSVPTGDST